MLKRYVTLTLAVMLLGIMSTGAAQATQVVDCDAGQSLNAAIAAASTYDRIEVQGVCNEQINVVVAGLTIEGPAVIDAAGTTGPAILVDQPWTVFRNLTVSGATASPGMSDGHGITTTPFGRYHTLTLESVTVTDNENNGVTMYDELVIVDHLTATNNGGSGFRNNGSLFGVAYISNSTMDGNAEFGVLTENTQGTVHLDTSTISNNAGGVEFHRSGSIRNSTIAGNRGPAMALFSNDIVVENVTITGNEGVFVGFAANMQVYHATIAGNDAPSGVFDLYGGNIGIAASIVHNNGDAADDCGDFYFGSDGYNIAVTNGCDWDEPTDLAADPRLGRLSHKGGATATMPLRPNSVAVDAIPAINCMLDSDQRGRDRPRGNGCDIGAFER